ncbi:MULTISPECIES: CoA transferase [Streptomyces]|uniref:CoA transferase n=1 Tax=Streptomyces TaxID=1883 RepID=UPI00240CF4E1|nr:MULTISPECIES: CoA transferase [Streptomyces]WFB82774.1 CoA transferase [Streptomyces olivaceus]WGK45073.1 CoA transferase [Streptomyces sp. B146]
MNGDEDETTAHAWNALGGPAELVGKVSYEEASGVLPARLPVRELARATVGVCSLAAAELLARRSTGPVPAVRVAEGAVATAFVSERHLRVDGRAARSFAPLSGFWRAADGWVRTHANYPHHRSRLLGALGISDTGDDRTLAGLLSAELATRSAHAVQEAVYAAGGLAVAVGSAPFEPVLPLVETGLVGESGPRRLPVASLPASGVRVLDLTRVIAGPVATRTLALLGADVLRVDPPRLPEDEDAHADTGFGKRSTLLDLSAPADRDVFEDLLGSADVVITGYRPGSLDRHGLSPEALLARRPGLAVAQLCAWGWSGPWASRRGFDSLVQAASGIASIEASADGRPGVLPAQALDHGTGYLLAAAVLRALTDQQATGGGRHLRLSLAGTASWLLHDIHPTPGGGGVHAPRPWLTTTATRHGLLDHALPPVHYDGAPRNWARPPTGWGTDLPVWI